ncbi:MAG: uroporphyrinogen-III C-methyltransferase [Xanthomonadales bacterium]|nr:uroporphyrinogen-III C-methyltransferase [Xanthomonadales bacterium]
MPPADAPLFPLFADLRGRRVLVVGGGAVAERKIEPLIRAGARIDVVSRDIGSRLAQWAAVGHVRWLAHAYEDDHLDGAWLVVVATGDPLLQRRVAAAAESRQVFANVVDASELCSVQMPAVVDRAPLQVAVSSGGAAPVLARQVRAQIDQLLDDHLGALAGLLHRHRKRIRRRLPELGARRRFLESMREGDVGRAVAAGDVVGAQQLLHQALAGAPAQRSGLVSLVGAGPGDPGLLTLKAQRRMQQADVILHDRLVPAAVLALARRDALLIETGKQSGQHHTSQARIHELMREHAQAGRRVVRLKGGDPFIFGRGGEELEFLRDAGIAFEVVPGVTAALACAAHAGIPLTHRDHAQSVRFVTAHCRDSIDGLDWPSLAREKQTLAVYMGVQGIDGLVDRLLAHGRDADTPAAIIENGSRPEQRVVHATLQTLPAAADAFKVASPALLIIGEVAALGATLHWFGAAPLSYPESAAATRADSLAEAA